MCGNAVSLHLHRGVVVGGYLVNRGNDAPDERDLVFQVDLPDAFGPEDLDFSLRLQEKGYKALYLPQAVALHEVNHTFEGDGYTAVYARSKAKHWLRFLRRHGTPGQKAGFFLVGAPWIALRMVFRELRRGNPGAIVGSVRGFIEAMKAPARPRR